jgi:hypothetical protein
MFNVIAVYAKPYDISLVDFLSNQLMQFPHMAIDISYTYIISYYLIPLYLRTRNKSLLIAGITGATLVALVFKAFLWFDHGKVEPGNADQIWVASWFMMVNFFNDGSVMRCGLFLSCRMLKNYYSKSQEKAVLLQENATAELQLLKAQVHPHFLFNTLNNIYSFSLRRSPVAASLVGKLSDTLRYMVNDCEAPLVPLQKEIKMLLDYIGLESVRYGNRLQLQTDINGDQQHKLIAPLLLIPLLENSFKHGTSQMLDNCWIKMNIDIQDDNIKFVLKNSKPAENLQQDKRNGIGLANVRKRLSLLYPGNHQFEISNFADSFEVFVSIPLLHDTTMTDDAGK